MRKNIYMHICHALHVHAFITSVNWISHIFQSIHTPSLYSGSGIVIKIYTIEMEKQKGQTIIVLKQHFYVYVQYIYHTIHYISIDDRTFPWTEHINQLFQGAFRSYPFFSFSVLLYCCCVVIAFYCRCWAQGISNFRFILYILYIVEIQKLRCV